MKNRVLIVLMGLTLSAAYAQHINNDNFAVTPTSVYNQTTAGLFRNEFDKQFSVNLDFGTFTNPFFYTGLANADSHIAKGDPGHNEALFGYYMPGVLPMSFWFVFGGKKLNNFKLISTNTTVAGGVTTKVAPVGLNILKEFDFGTQFITKVSIITLGAQFDIKVDKSALDIATGETHFQKTTTTAAGTATTVTKNNDTGLPLKYKMNIAVPLALKTGNLEHSIRPYITAAITNKSGLLNTTTTGTGALTENTKTTDIASDLIFGASYGLSLPAGSYDAWLAGAKLACGIASQSYERFITRSGAAPGAKSDKTTRQYVPRARFIMDISGGRLFNFKISETVDFKFKPLVSMNIITGPTDASHNYFAKLTKTTTAVDGTITTIVQPAVVASAIKTDFTMMLSMPMGITLRQKDWKLGFMLGVTPSLGFKVESLKAEQTTAADTAGLVTRTFTPIFGENHSIGIMIPFDGGVQLDATLTGHLLEINKFEIQVFIPLKR